MSGDESQITGRTADPSDSCGPGEGLPCGQREPRENFEVPYISSGLIVFDKVASVCSLRGFTDTLERILAAATVEPSFEKAASSIHSAIAHNDPFELPLSFAIK